MEDTKRSQQFLHVRLIDFIESGSRLFKLDWDETWWEFSKQYPQHSDLTIEQIKLEFFSNVLPNIFKYELTKSQVRRYTMLDSHPRLKRTRNGYQLKEEVMDNLQEKLEEMQNKHFIEYEKRQENQNIAAILTESNTLQKLQRITSCPVTQYWLTYFVSSKQELTSGTFLPHSTIRERFKTTINQETGASLNDFKYILEIVRKNAKFRSQLAKKLNNCFNIFKIRRRYGIGTIID